MADTPLPPLPAASVDLNAIHDALAAGADVKTAVNAGLGKVPEPEPEPTPAKTKGKAAVTDTPPVAGE